MWLQYTVQLLRSFRYMYVHVCNCVVYCTSSYLSSHSFFVISNKCTPLLGTCTCMCTCMLHIVDKLLTSIGCQDVYDCLHSFEQVSVATLVSTIITSIDYQPIPHVYRHGLWGFPVALSQMTLCIHVGF